MLFLDCQFGILTSDATERLFMFEVGGNYIVIHLMLIEHFANMKLD